jgi:Domain of unknown function (DUF4262)
MCWLCDHPGSTRLEYLAHVADLIGCHGWAVQGVQRDRIHPPWAYTVGLTASGKPELVVTGMPLVRATRLLDDVAAHVLHADAPRPGDQVPLVGGPLIEIVTVAEPAAHLLTAVEFYGSGVQALQLVHADDRGRWPWEVGFRGARGGQPVLGVRVPPPTRAA